LFSFLKIESSQAARHGGCFPPESTVLSESGSVKKLSELSVGDRIQSMDSQGRLVFSPVLLFLDRDLTEERDFVQLQSADGASVTMTASHLIYTVASQDLLEDVDVDLMNGQLQSNSLQSGENNSSAEEEDRLLDQMMANATMERFGTRLKATFASKVQIGDWIVSTGPDGLPKPQRVIGVSAVTQRGVLAPLTEEGTLVVDQVVVSCYAVIDDQAIAHWAFAPVRLLNNVHKSLVHFWRALSWWNHDRTTSESSSSSSSSSIPVRISVEARSTTASESASKPPTLVGIHWYAKMLYRIARFVLPSHLVFN
jgi:hedgehog protein